MPWIGLNSIANEHQQWNFFLLLLLHSLFFQTRRSKFTDKFRQFSDFKWKNIPVLFALSKSSSEKKNRMFICLNEQRQTAVQIIHMTKTSIDGIHTIGSCSMYSIQTYQYTDASTHAHMGKQQSRLYLCVCVCVSDVSNRLTFHVHEAHIQHHHYHFSFCTRLNRVCHFNLTTF